MMVGFTLDSSILLPLLADLRRLVLMHSTYRGMMMSNDLCRYDITRAILYNHIEIAATDVCGIVGGVFANQYLDLSPIDFYAHSMSHASKNDVDVYLWMPDGVIVDSLWTLLDFISGYLTPGYKLEIKSVIPDMLEKALVNKYKATLPLVPHDYLDYEDGDDRHMWVFTFKSAEATVDILVDITGKKFGLLKKYPCLQTRQFIGKYGNQNIIAGAVHPFTNRHQLMIDEDLVTGTGYLRRLKAKQRLAHAKNPVVYPALPIMCNSSDWDFDYHVINEDFLDV